MHNYQLSTINYRLSFLLLILTVIPGLVLASSDPSSALEAVDTEHGKVLLIDDGSKVGSGAIDTPFRDPFNWPEEFVVSYKARMKTYEKDPFEGLQLSAVFWSSNTPLVIINDVLLGVGEKLDNVSVQKITPDSVLLEKGDRHQILRLKRLVIDLGGRR